MAQQQKHPFIEWVDEVEKATGWTDNKWTTKASLSASVLSKARQGIIPKWEACKALALAAKRSPIVAFRRAGLLPPGSDDDVAFSDWEFLLNQLSAAEQDELREIAERKIERRQTEASIKTLKPKKVR